MYVWMDAWMDGWMDVCMYMYVYVCTVLFRYFLLCCVMYVRTYVRMYACMYVCRYTYNLHFFFFNCTCYSKPLSRAKPLCDLQAFEAGQRLGVVWIHMSVVPSLWLQHAHGCQDMLLISFDKAKRYCQTLQVTPSDNKWQQVAARQDDQSQVMELQGELRLRNNSITCESGEKTFCTLGTRQNMVAQPFHKTFFCVLDSFWTHSRLILDSRHSKREGGGVALCDFEAVHSFWSWQAYYAFLIHQQISSDGVATSRNSLFVVL